MTWGEAVVMAEAWAWRLQLPLVRRLTLDEARSVLELAQKLEDAREVADVERMESEAQPVDWRW